MLRILCYPKPEPITTDKHIIHPKSAQLSRLCFQGDIDARNNLGVALAMQGELEQALNEWQNVLKIDPANISARDNVRKVRKIMEQSNLKTE